MEFNCAMSQSAMNNGIKIISINFAGVIFRLGNFQLFLEIFQKQKIIDFDCRES